MKTLIKELENFIKTNNDSFELNNSLILIEKIIDKEGEAGTQSQALINLKDIILDELSSLTNNKNIKDKIIKIINKGFDYNDEETISIVNGGDQFGAEKECIKIIYAEIKNTENIKNKFIDNLKDFVSDYYNEYKEWNNI